MTTKETILYHLDMFWKGFVDLYLVWVVILVCCSAVTIFALLVTEHFRVELVVAVLVASYARGRS
jgi:hypothetical protein